LTWANFAAATSKQHAKLWGVPGKARFHFLSAVTLPNSHSQAELQLCNAAAGLVAATALLMYVQLHCRVNIAAKLILVCLEVATWGVIGWTEY
jgi:hypothetical protein